MSHAATNWAILQRGLKPATRVVLWHLCDRHNPDRGCFPSQARLAEDCEMSRSTLNEHLAKLEERRLVRRIEQVDPATKRQLPTRYIFAFEPDFEPDSAAASRVRNPDTENGAKSEETCGSSRVRIPDTACGKAVSGKSASRVRISGGAVSGYPDTAYKEEPVSEPVKEPGARARASEPEGSRAPGAGDGAASAERGGGEDGSAKGSERRGLSPYELRLMHETRLVLDWLFGHRPYPVVFRALDLRETSDEGEIEALALSRSRSAIGKVQSFVRWAELSLSGDPTAKLPIAPVKALMEHLADPTKKALLARRLALLMAKEFPASTGDEDATGPPGADDLETE
ncbi:MAG: helix-turn-helix domain-containing protein [Amphiplicatus sp.]